MKNSKVALKMSVLALALTGAVTLGATSPKAVTKDPLNYYSGAVYRFYDAKVGAHFFTASKAEADSVKANDPRWGFEGKAFEIVNYGNVVTAENTTPECADEDATPVYRFYRPSTLTHFYTISEFEKDSIKNNDKTWNYENVAYCAYTSADADSNLVPLYRFYRPTSGSHFFTIDSSEKDSIIAKDKSWNFENTAYYVKPLMSIYDTLQAGGYSKYLNAIDDAGLTETLKTTKNITVFPFSDKAVEILDDKYPGLWEDLQDDPTGDLKKLLQFGMLNTEKSFEDIMMYAKSNDGIMTLEGSKLDLELTETTVLVEGEKLKLINLPSSNGTIHLTNYVYVPASLTDAK